MKRCALVISLFVACFFFTSCRTVETVTEYVPVEIDVARLVEPLLDQRPADVFLVTNVTKISDVMANSVAWQKAYEDWKAYATALEEFCLSITTDSE